MRYTLSVCFLILALIGSTWVRRVEGIPVSWPYGTYGLIKTRSGCPGDQINWQSGWRYQDTENRRNRNEFSNNIANYLAGDFGSDIKTEFCIKTRSSTPDNGSRWPAGSYCILKYKICPYGFHEGHIIWDDEDRNNKNDKWGVMPDGDFNRNTRINYCCRKDGLYSHAITLPKDRPFVLLRFGGTCQSVQGMDARDLHIRWDNEDKRNKDSAEGMYPDDTADHKNHKLHFCYYQQWVTGL
ncbi:hypothetical protein MAR_007985 [Mya arenaria]|uniref:Apextrin C-terminal domain-containing protein n=1 Tax=Mya arenaria TaxID=6604 RepID=A0ABY7DX90_MYAAR|nr:uncharacterized protein LOC128229605 [Mya arenaria]WAR01427.1 hypothetical protein MAR_007985 [Mya arenaria]